MNEVQEATKELVTVAYRIGAVDGSGAEYFADGRTYNAKELRELYEAASKRLENALEAVGGKPA